ncbi:MAG: tetratricopeptide repeat protein [Candidatus Marinimicrobia bacterium]|nr:tetratricopeptide repeat protein [Candidatus Neomarinimicrobiota bacterium]MBL7022915.1 tetratricopeptide repeat protein [Candidatus Neomarinimicrobiota bacterium]MBL7110118.1 tetratricopeptide repeat protein [Candidatus Neomarinimicrobiota bacterium]
MKKYDPKLSEDRRSQLRITHYTKFICIFVLSVSFLFTQMGIPPQSPQPKSVPSPELEKAIEEYHQLIEKYPENSALNYNLGNLHYLQGSLDSAVMDYEKAMTDDNRITKSHTLYNMGNALFEQGNIQESVDFYKRALELNPSDEDIKHNYEFSKLMLQQQEQNQQGDENKEDEQKQEESEKNQQEQQEQENKQSESDEEQSQHQEQQKDETGEAEQKEKQQQKQSDEQDESEKQNQPQPQEMTEEEKRGKEEAEAILNALKASEENMMKKKYKAKGKIIMEKDW